MAPGERGGALPPRSSVCPVNRAISCFNKHIYWEYFRFSVVSQGALSQRAVGQSGRRKVTRQTTRSGENTQGRGTPGRWQDINRWLCGTSAEGEPREGKWEEGVSESQVGNWHQGLVLKHVQCRSVWNDIFALFGIKISLQTTFSLIHLWWTTVYDFSPIVKPTELFCTTFLNFFCCLPSNYSKECCCYDTYQLTPKILSLPCFRALRKQYSHLFDLLKSLIRLTTNQLQIYKLRKHWCLVYLFVACF